MRNPVLDEYVRKVTNVTPHASIIIIAIFKPVIIVFLTKLVLSFVCK